jgi:hypothetical protein
MMTLLYYSIAGLLIVLLTAILIFVKDIYKNINRRKCATIEIEDILNRINTGVLSVIWNTRPRERMFFHSIWGVNEPKLPRKILFIGENCDYCLTFVLKNLPPQFIERPYSRILYIDLNKCEIDENYNWLLKILNKLRLFNPNHLEDFFNSIEKALRVRNDKNNDRSNNEILNEIVKEINDRKIIVIFNNSQSKIDKKISTVVSEIINRVNDISILCKPVINPDISIENLNSIRKVHFVPNIFFDSTIFFASQHDIFEFQNRIYNGVDDFIFNPENLPLYLMERLSLSNDSLYYNLFKFFGGNEFYVEKYEGIKNIVRIHKDLLHDKKLLMTFHKLFFKERIDNLNAETIYLLLFICIAPFSVHYNDIIEFCNSFNIDFGDTTKILEDYLLIFKTDPSYYINLDIEFTLFEKRYSDKVNVINYLANGFDSNDEPYYHNCEKAKPLVRALINEALIQRFHRDWGYYVTNPLRRIIRYLFSEDNRYKKIVHWAFQHYAGLRETNDSPSVELAYTFFCTENNKCQKEKNQVDVSFDKLKLLYEKKTTSPKESFIYYSILLNKKEPIILSDRRFWNNLSFCYNHILNIPTVLVAIKKDEDNIEDNDEFNKKT